MRRACGKAQATNCVFRATGFLVTTCVIHDGRCGSVIHNPFETPLSSRVILVRNGCCIRHSAVTQHECRACNVWLTISLERRTKTPPPWRCSFSPCQQISTLYARRKSIREPRANRFLGAQIQGVPNLRTHVRLVQWAILSRNQCRTCSGHGHAEGIR